ncbi:hypothetical protein EB796_022477 [Bugula neritina]|uniref:Uncharacterized protein n=1 Tax=Bugula neritina TaxID=10212 RepID=A0A7J7J0L2_BUGNE|nr:hypothetical protein EB796_022477 [Bugula neritina]
MSKKLAKTSDPCSAMPMCKGSERGNSPTLVKRITSESCHTIEDFSFCDDEFEGILGLIAQRYDSDDVISSGEQETGPSSSSKGANGETDSQKTLMKKEQKENGKLTSKRKNVALECLLKAGDADGSGISSGTMQEKITADEKGEASTSKPFIKVITLPPLLDGGNCSVSQLFTKSTLGRYARQQRKTITIKKHDIQAEDVVLPPTTNKKDIAKKWKRRTCRKMSLIVEETTTSNSQTGNSKVGSPSLVKGHYDASEGDDTKPAVCKKANAADKLGSREQHPMLPSLINEKETAKKRKRGRASRKIAPILEETTTSKPPTENSEVALPTLVKDEDDTNSEGEAAAKSKLEVILETIKKNRNIIRLRPSKNGTADNKTRGKITFLEKGLKIVRNFSDNSKTVPHLPWIKIDRTHGTQVSSEPNVRITRNQLKKNPWLIHDRIKRERLENVQFFSSDLETATTSDIRRSTSLPDTPVSIHDLSSLSQNVSGSESLGYSDRTVTLKKHDVVMDPQCGSGSKQKVVKRKKLNLSWISESEEDSAPKMESLTTPTAHTSTAGNVQKVYPMNVKTIEVSIKIHTESYPSTRIVHQCDPAEGGSTVIHLPPVVFNVSSVATPSKYV